MHTSNRASFETHQWRRWLEDFPDYDQIGGHMPAVFFNRDVRNHLALAERLPKPSDVDYATLKAELSTHFELIGVLIGKKVEIGILAAVTGGIGLAADFVVPGTSLVLTWISGMLIAGGTASKFSAAREAHHVLAAKQAVFLWLRHI